MLFFFRDLSTDNWPGVGSQKRIAATPYDFEGSNMTAYGGLLPVATILEKLEFQQLIEEHVTIKRLTTSMPTFRFVLAMILALYVGFHGRTICIFCSGSRC